MQAPDVHSVLVVQARQLFVSEQTGIVPLHAPMSVSVHATHRPVESLHAGIEPLQSSAVVHAMDMSSPPDVPPSMLQLWSGFCSQ
jgi:hypothetical protein